MRWNVAFAIQGMLLVTGLYVTTLWPVRSEPALLIPVIPGEDKAAWRWIMSENASVIKVDTQTARITVVSKSQWALARAFAHGILPVRTTAAGCFDVQSQPRRED